MDKHTYRSTDTIAYKFTDRSAKRQIYIQIAKNIKGQIERQIAGQNVR